jgi:hypothetical protein
MLGQRKKQTERREKGLNEINKHTRTSIRKQTHKLTEKIRQRNAGTNMNAVITKQREE